jgi:ribosome-associated toxin RatA of RatAB toxin-antitoxin module
MPPAMPHVVRSALLPHPVDRMFALVDDAERYPEFLPWCEAIERSGFRQRLVTRNTRASPDKIGLELADGPFRRFSGGWTFTGLSEDGCKVELDLEFEFVRGLPQRLFAAFFTKAAGSLVDAFCKRARALE